MLCYVSCVQNGCPDRGAVWDAKSGGSREPGRLLDGGAWLNLVNSIEPSVCGGDTV